MVGLNRFRMSEREDILLFTTVIYFLKRLFLQERYLMLLVVTSRVIACGNVKGYYRIYETVTYVSDRYDIPRQRSLLYIL